MNAPLPRDITRQAASQTYAAVARISNEVAGRLAARLAQETQGEALFSSADRGRYATDASIYQQMPVGVFVLLLHFTHRRLGSVWVLWLTPVLCGTSLD